MDAESVHNIPDLSMECAQPMPASPHRGCSGMVDVRIVKISRELKEMEELVAPLVATRSLK